MIPRKRSASRGGVSLTEVMVAVAVAALPLLIAVSLINQNARGARMGEDRIMARMVLMDLMEVLLGEDIPRLRELSDDNGELRRMIEARVGSLPDFVRESYEVRVLPYARKARFELQESLGSEFEGLARIRLSLDLETGPAATVAITQLFRPEARFLPQSLQ